MSSDIYELICVYSGDGLQRQKYHSLGEAIDALTEALFQEGNDCIEATVRILN